MKNFIIIIVLAVLGMFFLTMSKSCETNQSVSQQQFYKETDSIENELVQVKENQKVLYNNQKTMNRKIDSILKITHNLETNQNNILLRMDTLQAGQVLIYSEVSNTSDPESAKYNFFDYAIDFFK